MSLNPIILRCRQSAGVYKFHKVRCRQSAGVYKFHKVRCRQSAGVYKSHISNCGLSVVAFVWKMFGFEQNCENVFCEIFPLYGTTQNVPTIIGRQNMIGCRGAALRQSQRNI